MKDVYENQCYHCLAVEDQPHEEHCLMSAPADEPAQRTYREAIKELTIALNALDQAHSMLKDINLHNSVTGKIWGRYANLADAVNIADSLLLDLQNVVCEECGKPMANSPACLAECCRQEVA